MSSNSLLSLVVYMCSLLLKYLSAVDLRESSADCLREIISKGVFISESTTVDHAVVNVGMEPVAKTKLIESLYKMLVSIGVLAAENVKVRV